MASFSGNFSSQYAYSVLYLDYSYSQNIDTNKTTFNYTLRIQKNTSTTQSYQANCPFGLNIGGKNLGGTFNLDLRNVGVGGSQTIKSGSLTFDHNDSGKLSNIVCSASVDTSVGIGDASLSGSVAIPDIPRASKFGTIENFNVEGTIVIPLTKYVDTWKDILTIKLDDVIVKTIDGVISNKEIAFTNKEIETIYNLMSDTNSKSFTFEIVTMNGDKQVGTTQITTAIGNITDANPILTSFVYEDVNPITLAVTNDANKIINGKSTLKITNLVANAVKGASLKLVQVNGVQYNYTDNFSVDIENYKGNTIVLYVIDSRNNSSKLEVLIGINFIDYSEPVIKNRNIERKNYIDEVSELSVDGSFTNINFGGSENTLTAAYKYKETGSNNWNDGLTDLEINIDNNLFNIDQAIKGDTSSGFDTTNSYDIKIIINDLLSTKEETITLIAGKPAMDVYKDKISFGGIADETSEFQTQFKDKANFENGIYVNGEKLGGGIDKDQLLDMIYPIGSLYMSMNETDPSELFGGSWERIKDRFIYANGDTTTSGTLGGSTTHNHGLGAGFTALNVGGGGIQYLEKQVGAWGTNAAMNVASSYNSYQTKSWGIALGGTTDNANIMPPYITAYVWKRIA